jgi:hypothetical protein
MEVHGRTPPRRIHSAASFVLRPPVSVISDGVLTALQLRVAEFHVDPLVPMISMAIEFIGVGVLAAQIRSMTRRAAFMATLLKT